jgi:hypothetical protein
VITARRVCAWLPAALIFGGAALAQPTFDPTGGPWSASVPGLLDVDGTPGPSSGDTPVWPEWEDRANGILLIRIPGCGDPEIDGDSSGNAGPGVLDTFQYNGLFVFDNIDAFNRPAGGSFDDGSSQGGVEGVDAGGDGAYEAMRVFEVGGGGLDMLFDFQFAETSGGGGPDFVSLGPVAVGTCGTFDGHAIWLPLTDVGGGNRGVILDLDDDGVGDPEFLVGPPLIRGESIPSVGQWGLVLLVLGTLIASLQLLRARA